MKSSPPSAGFTPPGESVLPGTGKAALQFEDRMHAGAAGILERMEEGFMLVDADWRILYVNAAGERLSGVSRDHLIGRNHWEVYPSALGTVVERLYRHAMTHCVTVRFEHFYAPYGRWFDSGASPVGEGALLLHAVDITNRKRAGKPPRAATMHARIGIDRNGEGFYIVRPVLDANGAVIDFQIADCNRRGAEFFQRRPADMIGQKISALYSRAGARRPLKMLLQAMESGFYEDDIEFPPGSPLRMQWARCSIVRDGGELSVSLRDISDIKAHLRELERRGNEDALTGLRNRYWAQCYLPQALERMAASGAQLAVLFIDLDGFKSVNDTLGHAAGDEVLRLAARRLTLAVRPHDKVVRYGGDEFVIILESLADRRDAEQVVARVLQAFGMSFTLARGARSIGASIGVSFFPADGKDADTLLRNADSAMYAAKSGGRNGCRFFNPESHARDESLAEFRHALDIDQFEMRYQPRVDLPSGTVAGTEALVRWMHPARGLLAPDAFLPFAEESGEILRLGELVIGKVCAQMARWRRNGCRPLPVSIKVSLKQISEADLAQTLWASCAAHEIEPRMIVVELREPALMGDSPRVAHTLAALHRMGVKIVVDDFGNGYASLSQMQRLSIDMLKVGGNFSAEVARSQSVRALFEAIVAMAHALDMRVAAEGVENADQARVLASLGCDEMQGLLVSPPLLPEQVSCPGAGLKAPFPSAFGPRGSG